MVRCILYLLPTMSHKTNTQQAGLTGNVLLLSSSIQYVINVVMTVPALIYVDRWGRRWTLIIGGLLMQTWLYANAGLMADYGGPAPPRRRRWQS